MEQLVFKTEVYEGPLDLLLALIAKNKMDILDIKIAPIFDQYMAYVDAMTEMDMEVAGEFITMASELMYIKSRMLLPKKEDEEDPREGLVRVLMEYKSAKEAAAWLHLREADFAGRFEKDTDEIKPDLGVFEEMDADVLTRALERMLHRLGEQLRERETNRPMDKIVPLLKNKPVPIPEKIVSVMRLLYRRKSAHFDELFATVKSRSEVIATFFAVLELLKAGRITLQKEVGDVTNSNLILNLNTEHDRTTEVKNDAG